MSTGHFKGTGGVIWTLALPLSEVMQGQLDKGELRRVNADGSPYIEPEPEAAADATPKRPVQAASKAEWVAWAVHNGMPETDANALSKAALIEEYGDHEVTVEEIEEAEDGEG